jgi:acetate kinase
LAGNRIGFASICAVGHRVVNGRSKYNEPQRVTQDLLEMVIHEWGLLGT